MKLITHDTIAPSTTDALRAMTYNIRMAPCLEDDTTENAWQHRLPKVSLILTTYRPDIMGLQEISAVQAATLCDSFTQKYGYALCTRLPTKAPIESGLGIMYNTARVQQVSKLMVIWLNESGDTPHAPAWDGSDYERFIISAQFKDLKTGKLFWFATTHFDHLGQDARTHSAHIALDLVNRLNGPTLLTGDFNCFPQLGGAQLYQLLATSSPMVRDAQSNAQTTFGAPGSWIGWDYDPYKQKAGHATYDYIFIKKVSHVFQHGIIDDRIWDPTFNKELYPSDH